MPADPEGNRHARLTAELRRRLARAYASPPRWYHTYGHAVEVVRRAVALGGDRPVQLAAWFHDAVYQPGRPDNEERSAELVLEWLSGDPDAEEAARLVRVTADHRADEGDVRAAVLCDADLAVLGGPPEAYAAYAAAVRREFAFVDPGAWAHGRWKVLAGLLSRDPLFATAEGRRRWESAARENMRAELDRLRLP